MTMQRALLMALLAAAATVAVCVAADTDGAAKFVNKAVTRNINLVSHITTVATEIEIAATSSGAPSKYTFAVEADWAAHLADISAKDDAKATLKVTKEDSADAQSGYVLYTVNLGKGLAAGATRNITVTLVLTHVQQPYPAEIRQFDNQLVVFTGNHYFASPYATTTQVTIVRLPSDMVESYSQEKPTSQNKKRIKYGPYKDIAPFSVSAMRLHFQNNSPFATITSCEREVEVSHWGNVAVEEHFDLLHTGAKLAEGFSRLDYQMRNAVSASFRSLVASFPAEARDLYYRDVIGNISTSTVTFKADSVEMEVQTRFPIFGGWKTQWYQGYNVPVESAVSIMDDGSYALSVGFGPSFADAVYDDLIVKVVLPEGATVTSVHAPSIESHTESRRFTYLDSPLAGRPVIEMRTKNFVHARDGELKVIYTMPAFTMLREPLMLIGAFFVLFASYSILSRVDLSLK